MSATRFKADAEAVDASNNAAENAKNPRPSGLIPFSYGQIGAVLAVVDFLAITLLGVFSYNFYLYFTDLPAPGGNSFFLTAAASAVAFVSINQLRSMYQPSEIIHKKSIVEPILTNWTVASCLILVFAFLGKVSADFSRGVAVLFFISGAVTLPILRAAARTGLEYVIAEGHLNNRRRILLLGSLNELAAGDIFNDLRQHGYGVEDEIRIRLTSDSILERTSAISAAIEQLKKNVREKRIDQIFLALDSSDQRTIDVVIEQLRSVPIPVMMLFDRRMSSLLSNHLSDLGTTKAVPVQSGPLTVGEQRMKRVLDVTLSLIGLFALAPVFALIAIAISRDSKGPVLFRQRRAGFNGRFFLIYKFRSMTTMDDGAVVKQATRNDQRVTRVGRFLRRTSLDELPQLLNVLQGDMSIVGPRPHALSHDNEYNQLIATYALRHHMKPGITGWAQINGFRGETSTIEAMERRVEFDLWYISHWSLLLDVKIIIKTTTQVLFPKDVY